MEQHTVKRLRYSFLFLLSAIVLLIFVIFVQSQIIFGQAEDMMGETPKEIITACENDELATLGANGLRCVEALKTATTQDINITTTSCPFGIKNFNIDSSRTLSYTCIEPAVCEENQFLSAQASITSFTCVDYDIPILKDKQCDNNYVISGFDEEGVPICTRIPNPLVGISCQEGQYLKGVGKHSLYMIGSGSNALYELNTEATGINPAKIVGESFGGSSKNINRLNDPVSIASHNGKLYMIGHGSNALYVLDTEATRNPVKRIGSSFGGSGDINRTSDPVSIASHNGKLYMIGDDNNALYVLDTEATTENPAKRIGLSFGGSGSSFGGGSRNRENTPTSITSHNGKLYMIGDSRNALYELNTEATGINPATRIGESFGNVSGSISSGRNINRTSDPVSIASHNGKLYMIGDRNHALYVLDTEATGNPAKRIGARFGGSGGNRENDPTSITSHNGKLYMIGGGSNALYELNTEATTGNPAKRIGASFGGSGSNRESDPTSIASISMATRDPICVNF